jgi:TPR repeat protein
MSNSKNTARESVINSWPVQGGDYASRPRSHGDDRPPFAFGNLDHPDEHIEANQSLTVHSMKLSADQGHAQAQFTLGLMFIEVKVFQ